METMDLPVQAIIADPEVQPRERLSEAAIMEYGEAMLAGAKFPPVVVLYEERDRWWLASGFLRLAAAKAIGREMIDVQADTGNKRAALLYSCTTNATHGFRRTNRDKRRAVLKLLRDGEWVEWSDREIARTCRVSPGLVATMRAELGICGNGQIDEPETRKVRRGKQEYDMRMPQPKDRTRFEPERWALACLYDDIDALYEHTIEAGVEPSALMEHLNPARAARLRSRLFECLKWLRVMDDELAGRKLEEILAEA
jgi:hypothetical protein